ncbi:MAG: hypothetical protein DCF25_11330 [Leptolyngbya foveolarum]|uniref:Uncharacterized protein n=1 Tax=Leptolyngbya foveolarum TaxID=47253 RepID=A0A2W4U9N1_9CYAN|nr:MAG: hypothetical protein DCF25_11330 [Leptolyngbya foveolarum]
MSLPIILEIAIGLIFIYLTLSLVASEIQEILSALFQWRAEHLKRSIEQLLAGDSLADRTTVGYLIQGEVRDPAMVRRRDASTAHRNRRAAKTLADRLYDSPLIEDLNYEAQGRLAGLLRYFLHGIGAIYRTLTFSRNVFGTKTSGPSYIPAETFATSLIERLKLEDFQRVLTRSRFEAFVHNDVRSPLHNSIQELRARTGDETLLTAEVSYFDQQLSRISEALAAQQLTLETAINQVVRQIQSFEEMAAELPLSNPVAVQSFSNRIKYLRTGLVGQSTSGQSTVGQGEGTAVLIARVRPSLSDLTALLDPSSATYNELVSLTRREGAAVNHALSNALETIQNSEVIPARLRSSLATLASRAESRVRTDVHSTGNELQQLQTELETWFNNGMTRASGVYRRNVKGVGLMIGLAIAFTINADTFYMFQRLSTDPAIRSSIVQAAEQIEVRGIETPEQLAADSGISELSDDLTAQIAENMEVDLRSVGTAVERSLAQYPLPIGRSKAVIEAQQAAEQNWPIKFIPQRLVGWLITALALSMGASFWFDLLRKVMSVRASGDKPKE